MQKRVEKIREVDCGFFAKDVYSPQILVKLPSEVQNMQNNNNQSRFGSLKNFLKDKGYYIVLILCLAAVGISGYIFVSTAVQQNDSIVSGQESLSVPTKIEDTTKTKPSRPETSSVRPDTSASVPSFGNAESGGSTETNEDSKSGAQEPAKLETPQPPAIEQTAWPIDGSTVQPYSVDQLSYNATMQDWRTHNGIDIAAAAGQAVMAAADGTVTAIYEDDYLGTTVVLSHGSGYTTRYCNLEQETTVSIGDSLKCGDQVGKVGQTAMLEIGQEPHLHFEVYCNNVSMDPTVFLS